MDKNIIACIVSVVFYFVYMIHNLLVLLSLCLLVFVFFPQSFLFLTSHMYITTHISFINDTLNYTCSAIEYLFVAKKWKYS